MNGTDNAKKENNYSFFNPFHNKPLFYTCLQCKSFENSVKKGEIASNEQYLLFPQRFLPCQKNFLPFSSNLKLSSAL